MDTTMCWKTIVGQRLEMKHSVLTENRYERK